MTPKSIVYMIVAVFIGYMLISAVPGQVALYTSPPLSGERGDTITGTGEGFLPENESSSVEENETVELFWDTVTTNGTHGIWIENESIRFEVEGSNETPSGSIVIVEGHGFSADNDTQSDEVIDYSADFEELSGTIVELDEVYEISSVEAASAAADAVESVASTAGEASEAAADAAEAASALKSARSGFEFVGTMLWLTVDVLIALVVYWFAKQRFS